MLINTSSTAFKVTRGVLGVAGSIGAGALATAAMVAHQPLETKKYKQVAVKIAIVSLGIAAGDIGRRVITGQVNDVADLINEYGRIWKTASAKIKSTSFETHRGE